MNIGTAELREKISDTVNRAVYGGERIILERRGKPIAAIVSLDDLALIEEAEDRADVIEARKARKEGGQPVSLTDVAERLGIDLKRPVKPRTNVRKRSA